jgi:DNA polymerase III epsilon subunit-like protein
MAWLTIAAITVLILILLRKLSLPTEPSLVPIQAPRKPVNIQLLPPRFVVLDLETTGLDPERNEIIEIGAIRVNRDSDVHDTFRALVKPTRRIPKRITQINGISQEMVDRTE